jgi:hypothetical protein
MLSLCNAVRASAPPRRFAAIFGASVAQVAHLRIHERHVPETLVHQVDISPQRERRVRAPEANIAFTGASTFATLDGTRSFAPRCARRGRRGRTLRAMPRRCEWAPTWSCVRAPARCWRPCYRTRGPSCSLNGWPAGANIHDSMKDRNSGMSGRTCVLCTRYSSKKIASPGS